MVKGCGKYMEIHRNIRKYMKTEHVHEFAFICYVLACILNAIQKDTRRKHHAFWRYSDLQIFYQDSIGDQNDGWFEPSPPLIGG